MMAVSPTATEGGRANRLSPSEERALFDEWAAEKSISARNRLIEAHLWLVVMVSREYRCNAADRSDLVGEGHLGLLSAFERFDPTLGVRFATYARHWVHASMSAFFLRTTNALGSLARSRADAKSRRQSCPSPRDVSLDAPLAGDNDATLLDCLSSESVDVDAQIECKRRDIVVASTVANLVATFDQRELVIYESRFPHEERADDPVCLDVVAGLLRLSPERVRQLEERVRTKLANGLRPVLEPALCWAV